MLEVRLAEADAMDRESELTGCIKTVASFAAIDGLVLLSPRLEVSGFGVKIAGGPRVATVYHGPAFSKRGTAAPQVDLSSFGTRHRSMLSYCRCDPKALGIVVSQDGDVRLVMSQKRSLTLGTRQATGLYELLGTGGAVVDRAT